MQKIDKKLCIVYRKAAMKANDTNSAISKINWTI